MLEPDGDVNDGVGRAHGVAEVKAAPGRGHQGDGEDHQGSNQVHSAQVFNEYKVYRSHF